MFMLYDETLKQAMLDILEQRVSGIADSINALAEDGFVPNRNKINILNWSSILIHAYENINIFTKEQQQSLDVLYNKVIKM